MAKLSRRVFLGTGVSALAGLAVGVGWLSRIDVRGTRSIGARGSAQRLNAFVEILPDSRVRLLVPRVEMGQGAQTGVATLIAEELDVALSMVSVEHPTELLPAYINTALAVRKRPEDLSGAIDWTALRVFSAIPYIGTGGSTTTVDAWLPARIAGAGARRMLIDAAALKWGVSAAELTTADGIVYHRPSQRQAPYGELAADAAHQAPPAAPVLKTPAQWKLIGKPGVMRVDLPDKVTGRAQFGVDVKLPGLRVGTLVHAPKLGATLAGLDDSAVASLPGKVELVRGKDYVAAVADSYWYAQQALAAVKPQWSGGADIDNPQVHRALEAALAGQGADTKQFRDDGDAPAALAKSARTIEARYQVPYLAHACMEPMNATAWFKADGSLEVWAPIQSSVAMEFAARQVLGSVPKNAVFHTTLLGGGFGRRGERDYVERAIEVAKALPGKPIKLIWSREEDIARDMYRPAAFAQLRGALDAQGQLQAFEAHVSLQSVQQDFAKRNLPYPMSAAGDPMNVEGLRDLAYAAPHVRIVSHAIKLPVPVGNWRGVGNSQNAFFAESFIDELAHLAGEDPLAFRMRHLAARPRWQALAARLKEVSDWGSKLDAGVGRGVAIVECFRSICGQVAQVRVAAGMVKVERVDCVVDCGTVVNPDIVRAQVQSGVVYGLTAALYGKIDYAGGAVVQRNFNDYPMLRLADAPIINVHMMTSSEPPGGIGEPGTPPIAAAVANAIFAATGKRVRSLPIADQALA